MGGVGGERVCVSTNVEYKQPIWIKRISKVLSLLTPYRKHFNPCPAKCLSRVLPLLSLLYTIARLLMSDFFTSFASGIVSLHPSQHLPYSDLHVLERHIFTLKRPCLPRVVFHGPTREYSVAVAGVEAFEIK